MSTIQRMLPSLIDEFELLSSEADLIFGVDTKGF